MKHYVLVEVSERPYPKIVTMLEALPHNAKIVYSGTDNGVKVKHQSTGEEAVIPYARWFDKESSSSWSAAPYEEYNWLFLRSQENWANDMLRARGYLSLNDVHNVLGLSQTAIGMMIGWVYEKGVKVDFGCWEQETTTLRDDGAILLDFNIQGPILHALA